MFHTELHAAPERQRKPSTCSRAPGLLTEDQVRSMSEDQYMNPAQLEFFTSRLIKLEDDLVSRARRADAEIATSALEADPVDRASVEEEHRMALGTRARDAAQLVEVRAALARIASGDFGYCNETGDPIGIARLLIQPTTVLTTEAQQRQESRTRRYRA
jgi:DnaK suppressor protein